MAEKTVAMPDNPEIATQPEGTRTRERYVTPPVDIYDLPEGLVVTADVPGATHEHLDIDVDHHILIVEEFSFFRPPEIPRTPGSARSVSMPR